MNPNDNLGFLFHHLSSLLDRRSDVLLQQHLQIGFSQFKIMLALASGEGVQHKHIAHKLHQTEASVSRQIKRMGYMRLLTSRVNPDNRRERYVVLTPTGAEVLRQATILLNDYFGEIFTVLGTDQQIGLREALLALDNELTHKVTAST